MKTRINKIFKINNYKLKDKIYNRYGFDKIDRKNLNNIKNSEKWKYYDVSKLGSNAVYALDLALLAKGSSSGTGGTIIFVPQAFTANNATDIVVSAIAFDEAVIVVIAGGATMTFGEVASQALSQFIQMGATEITKEEFYNLDI